MKTNNIKQIIYSWCVVAIVSISSIYNALADNSGIFMQANDYYSQQLYDSAAITYESLIQESIADPILYYNAANTQFKLRNLGKAILYYERALLLDPSHSDSKNNLAIAQSLQVDQFDDQNSAFDAFISFKLYTKFNSNTWAIFSLVGIILCLSLLLVYLFTKQRTIKKIAFFASVIMAVLSVYSWSSSYRLYNDIEHNPYAIVTQTVVQIKTEPHERASLLTTVHEGLKVKVLTHTGNWCNIRLQDGKEGWIDSKSIERI